MFLRRCDDGVFLTLPTRLTSLPFHDRNEIQGSLLDRAPHALAEAVLHCACPTRVFPAPHLPQRSRQTGLQCAHRTSTIINSPSKLACTSLQVSPGLVHNCARRTTTVSSWGFREQRGPARPHSASFQACLFPLSGWRLIDLPLRASNEHRLINVPSKLARFSLQRLAWSILKCARRTRPFSFFIHPFRGVARLPFTGRIERPLLHRGGSASKKGTWPLLPRPSEGARSASRRTTRLPISSPRCASTGDQQAPSYVSRQ